MVLFSKNKLLIDNVVQNIKFVENLNESPFINLKDSDDTSFLEKE
jgi:hypothetical protein